MTIDHKVSAEVEAKHALLEKVGAARCPAGRPEAGCYPLGTGGHGHRFLDLATQLRRRQIPGRQARTAMGYLDAPRDLKLVAPVRYSAHRYATGERLLGGSHPTMRHRTHRAVQHNAVWNELQHSRIARFGDVIPVPGRQGCNHVHRVIAQRGQGGLNKVGIRLSLR